MTEAQVIVSIMREPHTTTDTLYFLQFILFAKIFVRSKRFLIIISLNVNLW